MYQRNIAMRYWLTSSRTNCNLLAASIVTGSRIENKRILSEVRRVGVLRARVRPRGGLGNTLALFLWLQEGRLFRNPWDSERAQKGYATEAATCWYSAFQVFGSCRQRISEQYTDPKRSQCFGCVPGESRPLPDCSSNQRIAYTNRDPQRQRGRILLEAIKQCLYYPQYNPRRLTC
jgi:hypothetical protein